MTKTKTMQEIVKATEFSMGFKGFNDHNPSGLKWSDAFWEVANMVNCGIREVYKFEVRQAGKDDNGFYENFISLIVPMSDSRIWGEYLERLGFGYREYTINLLRITAEWNEGIDEVVAEFDI